MFGGRRNFTHVDFCRSSNRDPLNWGGEGGESQFWKVKEDLEDLGVSRVFGLLDTSA